MNNGQAQPKFRGVPRWEITNDGGNSTRRDELLAQGWEPFSASVLPAPRGMLDPNGQPSQWLHAVSYRRPVAVMALQPLPVERQGATVPNLAELMAGRGDQGDA